MNKISTFTIKDTQVDLLYQNGKLAYAFEYEGKHYGQGIKLPSKTIIDIASVTFLLLANFLDTYEALTHDK